jgi:hypothetical protein
VNDYSEIEAGRSSRLAKLDEALAFGRLQEARAMALRDYVDSARLLRWIDRRIARAPAQRGAA